MTERLPTRSPPPKKPQDVTRFPAPMFFLIAAPTWWDHWKTLQGSLNISSLPLPTFTQENCVILTGVCTGVVDCVWNVVAHAQKPNLVFRQNGRVQLNRRGRQFSRLLAAEVCSSAVVMLDTPCSEVVWRVLATHSILQFPLHFPSRASPCAITFQLESTASGAGRKEAVGFEYYLKLRRFV